MSETRTDDAKIALRDVTKIYEREGEEFRAVDGLSLDIPQGEFVTLVGPSGCGKTTVLQMAAGLVEPDAGKVFVAGEPVTGPGPERGVIFQQFALFPWLTVRKNVEFGLRLAGVPRDERKERADHYLDLVDLSEFANSLPKTLSGGMKQRCAIARAYAVNPEVLLMDEPFGALDAMTRVTLNDQLLDTWSREQRTVLFITHDVDEAVYLANHVVVMTPRPGKIRTTIPVELPHPRTNEMRFSTEFAEIRSEVWRAVHQR